MKFNKKQRKGLFSLFILIALIQFVIIYVDFSRVNTVDSSDFSRIEYYKLKIDSVKRIDSALSVRPNRYKFNPNKLSYKSWKYLGVNTDQLYLLDSFLSKNRFSSKKEVRDVLKLTDSVYYIIDTLMYFPKKYTRSNYVKNYSSIKYEVFDPNDYKEEDWVKIGFSEKQASAILNFTKNKGPFLKKEDLKEVYVVSNKKYLDLEPYLKIENISLPIIRVVTINTATREDFKKIEGIGDVYSNVIVDYRDRLGGFRFNYQLKEINIIDSVLYARIMNKLDVEKDFQVKTINVNSASLDRLKSHPYISWRLAKSIVDFRDNFREFKSLEELKNIEVISDAYFDKIELYLTLE